MNNVKKFACDQIQNRRMQLLTEGQVECGHIHPFLCLLQGGMEQLRELTADGGAEQIFHFVRTVVMRFLQHLRCADPVACRIVREVVGRCRQRGLLPFGQQKTADGSRKAAVGGSSRQGRSRQAGSCEQNQTKKQGNVFFHIHILLFVVIIFITDRRCFCQGDKDVAVEKERGAAVKK